MKNLNMFCLTLESNHYKFIKELGYIPVGLGEKNFNENWFSDKSGINISKKNKYYSEYTFHYWLWKNYLDQMDDKWIGFCQYKKFWSLKTYKTKNINIESLNGQVLKQIPREYENYDTILTEPMFVNQWRTMKFIKMGLKIFIKNPLLIFNKKKRNLNFHFDLMHGENNLCKAINLLGEENKNDFRKFVNSEVSFNPHIMVICKSKEKLKRYYEDVFPWLEKCEKIFGFENLQSYNKIRIYGFLAERFMSYWFQKNTKYTTMPVIIYDIRKDIN
mgnify:FL=1|jgi:hypothetical protein|tara:strand:+ start:51 stop:872 length:822 start_codon:yes stop_codon:yes gene_type:complete